MTRAWFVVRAAPTVFALTFAAGSLLTLWLCQWRIVSVRDETRRRFAELSVARMQAEPQPQYSPLSELRDPELRGKVFRIADLVQSGSTIRGRTFVDCDIYGPAVLLPNPQTVSMRGNILLGDGGIEGVFLRLDPAQRVVYGVIALEESRVELCRLVRVGIAGSPAALEVFRKAFEPPR